MAGSATMLADERIRSVESEATWHKATLEAQLAQSRAALELATKSLLAEQASASSLLLPSPPFPSLLLPSDSFGPFLPSNFSPPLASSLPWPPSPLRSSTPSSSRSQSAVFTLRSMLLVADADVAAMRGAAAHYAALGGEEAGALREALSHAEVIPIASNCHRLPPITSDFSGSFPTPSDSF